MPTFQINEKYLSQIPALKLLINMGYEYLSPAETFRERGGKYSNVLLENVLRSALKDLNRINYMGREYLFSEDNLQSAIGEIKNIKYDGLLKTNRAVYDLLTLGKSLEQTIEGDTKSHTLNYIDWFNPRRNKFHVAAEYRVERSRSTDTIRPDLVLFVNGIPFCVIECKAPQIEVDQAVTQTIRNQKNEYIPGLFIYNQLVLALNKNSARYGTTGTAKKFWSAWKEKDPEEEGADFPLRGELINKPLPPETTLKIEKTFKDSGEILNQKRSLFEQDKTLYALCRPERLLELVWKFTLFDNGNKKIARYQQYFVVKSTMERIKQKDNKGARKGGIIWHTQGSGKSLTMVMIARNLALDPEVSNPRIVLVTDRNDLDDQLGNTFVACGLEADRATSGRNLLELIAEKKSGIITTLIHKFDKAYSIKKYRDSSPDIFVLVDESHRTNFGSLSAYMRQMFPNASYLGFTGTPLLKDEKNNFVRFGELIEPHYSINQAVEDGAVVPLLYEGRHVEMTQNSKAMDLWFERHTEGLSDEQKADLKHKYSRASMLNKTDKVIFKRAFDISEHYRANWQGTGFKAQLVAPDRPSAIRYKKYLDEIGMVKSEIVISPPNENEGKPESRSENKEVITFWHDMMQLYGSEQQYTQQLLNRFKYGDTPEILIVVDKLLTGFDAPKNTVLYVCAVLKEHRLLQAIARVNRLHEGKEFGFILDYASVLGELDKALTMYDALEGFDEYDIEGALVSINKEIDKLPGIYSDLWDLFKTVKNSDDEEEYELLLADDDLREDFYERLSEYSKNLAIAFSTEKFLSETDGTMLSKYKEDLRRFQLLRKSVKLRYAEAIDYRDYEPKIKKLLDTHIQAKRVTILNKPVDIFDENMFNQVKEKRGIYDAEQTIASKADTIAHATKKVIIEKMNEDPAFYEKFSILVQQAIDDFRNKRISELDYLDKVILIRNKVVKREYDYIPGKLKGNKDAMAYYGILKPILGNLNLGEERADSVSANIAINICRILQKNIKVNFWDDGDAQNQTRNEIDDLLFDLRMEEKDIRLSVDQMDEIIEKALRVAKYRSVY